jgi:predicted O-methyltransferase YrrM
MIHTKLNLIKHYASATPIDVLHSPFVFELYHKCLGKQKYPIELAHIEAEWKKTLANNNLVKHQDFGARGLTTPVKTKPLSFFAKKSAKPKRLAHLIYNLIKNYKYQNCIELGTSLGYTAMHIASALPPKSKFVTIEGCPAIAEQAAKHLMKTNLLDKVEIITGNFDAKLPEMLSQFDTIDFAFIDGNHTYDATTSYFHQLLLKRNEHTLMIFDDIYWSRGMTRAWEEIKLHPEVTVTVDLFFIGLVYFKKDQQKQHFSLRLF